MVQRFASGVGLWLSGVSNFRRARLVVVVFQPYAIVAVHDFLPLPCALDASLLFFDVTLA
jgi:hypothetical protein